MRDEKNLFPNLDFFSAVAFHLGVPTADVHADLRLRPHRRAGPRTSSSSASTASLIRPTAEYTGPEPRRSRPPDQR